jgi:hypothetical protein
MNKNKLQKECEALNTIRIRWTRRGAKFTPLERIDGVNETLESIDALKNSPVCWSRFGLANNIEQLLDDLEDNYRHALAPWNKYRTLFDCKAGQREFLRWPEGTFPKKIQREATSRFWELITTSRFSVNAAPCVQALQEVNTPIGKFTLLHIVSLAVMVCILDAIQALEQVEYWWREDSGTHLQGQHFDWLCEHDPEKIDLILSAILAKPEALQPYDQAVIDSREALAQADAWLSHLATMNFHQKEYEFKTKEMTASFEGLHQTEINKATKEAISQKQSEAASKKNTAARSWVLNEWEIRADKKQAKDAFGRQYVPLVKKQFGVKVNATTISHAWLPKIKK